MKWYQNSPSTWILKAPSKDGGAVAAMIERKLYDHWTWEAAGQRGTKQSQYAAQRAARKALKAASLEQWEQRP
jgi:hypothetical protein